MQTHPTIDCVRIGHPSGFLPPASEKLPGTAAPAQGKYACKPANKVSGLTLIELLITLVIAGILASMAMPSLSNMLLNQRLGTAAEELYMSLNFARSEAVTRGFGEVITITPNSAADWGQGWSINTTPAGGTALTLKTFQAKKNVLITAPDGSAIAAQTYGRSGRLVPPAGQLTFYVTNTGDPNTGVSPRCVIVSPSGQPMIRRDNNRDGDCNE